MSRNFRYPCLMLMLAATAIGLVPSWAQDDPSFQGLGDLTGGEFSSQALGVSGNGNEVVGFSTSGEANNEAFWWAAGNMMAEGDLNSTVISSGLIALAHNGGIGAGFGTASAGQVRAVIWNSFSGMTNLGTLGGASFSSSDATDISGDGTVVVGRSTSFSGFRAFRWTDSSGMQNLGVLRTDTTESLSGAEGVSDDGSTIVGWSSFTIKDGSGTVTDSGKEAFYWTSADGITGLGDLSGGDLGSEARGVSADGSVIVGFGTTAAGSEGVVWSDGVAQSVGDIPGGATDSRLRDVSADGLFAVGEGQDDIGRAAVIWDANNGLRQLSTVLTEKGVDFSTWRLQTVNAISDDGNVLVGSGFNPNGKQEAWRITNAASLFEFIPPPPPPLTKLRQSIRIFFGRGIQFEAQPGDIHQLQGRTVETDWESFGEIFSSVGAAGPVEFILPIGYPEPGYEFFRINRLPGSNDETPFVVPLSSIVDGAIFTFTAEPDMTYRVETSADLSGWANLGPLFDTTGNTEDLDRAVVDPFDTSESISQTKKFYRIQQNP